MKRKQQIQPIQYFTTKLPFAGKAVATWSWRSCCFWLFTLQKDCIHAQRVLSSRSCSISWHSFSPWHNLSKLSSAHGLPKELFIVVNVVFVVFPPQQGLFWHRSPRSVVSCCLPCRRLVTRVACVLSLRSVVHRCKCCFCCFPSSAADKGEGEATRGRSDRMAKFL